MHLALFDSWQASGPAKIITAVGLVLALNACVSAPILGPAPVAQRATENFSSLNAFESMSAADWQETLTPLFDQARKAVQQETGTNLEHITFAVVSNEDIERDAQPIH